MVEKTVPEIKKENPVIQREVTRNSEYFATPLVDIYETKEGLKVLADLPGVTKDGLKVQVEDGILTIEGKASVSSRDDWLIQEYEPTNFFRQFELSENVAQDKITAELKNGVLILNLPKAESAKPREIKVNVA